MFVFNQYLSYRTFPVEHSLIEHAYAGHACLATTAIENNWGVPFHIAPRNTVGIKSLQIVASEKIFIILAVCDLSQ